MSFLDRLERSVGHLAIPHLLRYVAGYQALCFVLLRINPSFGQFLILDPQKLREGEIWRLITPAFIPRTDSLIWIFFAIMLLIMIGDTIEYAWGKFRLNVYFFSMLILQAVAAFAFHSPGSPSALYAGLFFAFAFIDPNRTILLLVIPVAAKWLALLVAAGVAYEFASFPVLRMSILFGLLPFAAFAIPATVRQIRHGARVQARRAVYRANSLEPSTFFHKCAACGRTDTENPELEFRVASDGHEYCTEHLPAT